VNYDISQVTTNALHDVTLNFKFTDICGPLNAVVQHVVENHCSEVSLQLKLQYYTFFITKRKFPKKISSLCGGECEVFSNNCQNSS